MTIRPLRACCLAAAMVAFAFLALMAPDALAATASSSTTSAPSAGSVPVGGSVTDTATVSDPTAAGVPSGTVTFSVCGPLPSAAGCPTGGGTVVGTVTLTQGSTNATATSPSFVPNAAGTWCFNADYSGDSTYLSSTDGSPDECFTVLAPPSATIYSPAQSAIYAVGQAVQANYSCAEASGGPGLTSCTGTVPDGAPIYTATPGQYTFSVTAMSEDGSSTTVSATYTVAAPPSVWITSPTNGATYTVGEVVGVGYGCAEGAFGPGLASCSVPGAVDTHTTGTFSFTASATSLDGQTATATIHYNVVAPSNQPPAVTAPVGQTTVPPALSEMSQSHRRWRLGSKLATLAAAAKPPVGTTFRFKLNEAATVRFTFAQLLPGRKVHGKCVAQTPGNRGHKACTRAVPKGTLSFSAGAGLHKLFFQGRLTRTRMLKPGAYTLTITATNSSGQRVTAIVGSFTIVPG